MKKFILNLSDGFVPFDEKKLNQDASFLGFEYFQFPGGEPHIKLQEYYGEVNEVVISLRPTDFNEIGKLLVAVDAVKRNLEPKSISLFMPYFPGARQDRPMVYGEPFTAKIYADLINNLNFDKVIIIDAHSDVAPALIENVVNTDNSGFIEKVLEDINNKENLHLVSPDAGANKKIAKLVENVGELPTVKHIINSSIEDFPQGYKLPLYKFTSVIKCDKSRDLNTGKITSFDVYAEDLKGKDCLIVDDICDGGGTFKGLAASLKEKGAGKIYLAVTHGIFSKGFDGFENINKIYSTDSFIDSSVKEDKLKVIPISKLTS